MAGGRKLKATIAAAILLGVLAPAAVAEKPGPGSSLCSPGQNGSPQPGFKPGPCPPNK